MLVFCFVFLPIYSSQVLLLKRKMSLLGSCLALGLGVVYSKVQVYDWKGECWSTPRYKWTV